VRFMPSPDREGALGKSRSSARHAWEPAFLEALREHGKINAAARAAGVTSGAPYSRRMASASFDSEWTEALATYRAGKNGRVRNSEARPAPRQWKRVFLDALAETSNVAGWIDGQWTFAYPTAGLVVHERASASSLTYRDGWQRLEAPSIPTGGDFIDAQARTAIEDLIALLRQHGLFA